MKSPQAEHQVEGVRLLQGTHFVLDDLLAPRAHLYEIYMLILSNVDIYRAEPGRRRECLYYLALGHYKMGNYEEARRFNGTSHPLAIARGYPITACRTHRAFLPPAFRPAALLLDKEPSNLQAQSLASLIDTRVTRGASLLRSVHV